MPTECPGAASCAKSMAVAPPCRLRSKARNRVAISAASDDVFSRSVRSSSCAVAFQDGLGGIHVRTQTYIYIVLEQSGYNSHTHTCNATRGTIQTRRRRACCTPPPATMRERGPQRD